MLARSSTIAALAVFATAAVACQTGVTDTEATPSPSSSIVGALPVETLSALFDNLRGGVLYGLIGPIGSGNVWMLDLDKRVATQLTHNPEQYGISNFDASPAGLVLGDAASGIDMVTVYRDSRAEDIVPGGLNAGDPAISSTGDVAFVGIPDDDPHTNDSWQILTMPVDGGVPELLYEQRGPDLSVLDLGGLAWGSDGRLAVVSAPGERFGKGTPELLVIDESGNVELRVRAASVREFNFVAWNQRAPGIAIGNVAGDAALVGLDGNESPLVQGWAPQCWAPDGSALLVTQQEYFGLALVGQVKVGIWRPQHADRVDQIVEMPLYSALWGCSWLDTAAAHTT